MSPICMLELIGNSSIWLTVSSFHYLAMSLAATILGTNMFLDW